MLNPFALVRSWWVGHGTKIMGFWTALVGAVTYIDEKTVHLIGTTFGDAWEHGILVASGLVTAYRGFTNSAKTNVANTDGPH